MSEQLGQWQMIGIAVISSGLLAMSFDGKGRAPDLRLLAYAALTDQLVALYSVVDAEVITFTLRSHHDQP